mmetsp:Transcript_129/g.316  ORF Transcript_129/g.316 Transcript_129/m.316 type:complete len:207 (-) Transcript_129:2751-3371(-)
MVRRSVSSDGPLSVPPPPPRKSPRSSPPQGPHLPRRSLSLPSRMPLRNSPPSRMPLQPLPSNLLRNNSLLSRPLLQSRTPLPTPPPPPPPPLLPPPSNRLSFNESPQSGSLRSRPPPPPTPLLPPPPLLFLRQSPQPLLLWPLRPSSPLSMRIRKLPQQLPHTLPLWPRSLLPLRWWPSPRPTPLPLKPPLKPPSMTPDLGVCLRT